ncbi:MAG: hypothetical protein K2L19_06005 [Eubacterium sp.]|nr:hypothetical protein [Eubacterium sp.]
MDCPYYDLGTCRCKISGEYTYDTYKRDTYCFESKYGYDNCQVYKDYWAKR